jgi:HEPN domain-containing protein
LDVAETLFKNKKYDWCLFIGYLVIEKVIKANWIKKNKKNPPKIHNLLKLIQETDLKISDDYKQCLVKINEFNISTRYPDVKLSFYKICDYKFANENFNKIKEIYLWLINKSI